MVWNQKRAQTILFKEEMWNIFAVIIQPQSCNDD